MKPICSHHYLIAAVFVLLCFTACQDYPELVPEFTSTVQGNIIRTDVQSFDGVELTFVVDFFMVNNFGNYVTIEEDNLSMELKTLENIQLQNSLVSLECSKDFGVSVPGSLSVSMLIDQSGSMESNDSTNQRIAIGKQLASGIRPGDELSLMVFAGNPALYPETPTVLVDFRETPSEFTANLNSLSSGVGGGTPLFEALYQSILYTAQNGKNADKAVVMITDEGASDEGEQVDSVICLANSSDVNLHIIKVGQASQNQVLNSLVIGTSGVSMDVEAALNINSLSNFYDGFVSDQVYDFFYRSVWKTTRNSGDWENGFILDGVLAVTLENQVRRNLTFKLLVCP